MFSNLDMTILFCGVATFLLRWIPIWQSQTQKALHVPPLLRRILEAIGPAAITALLVISLVPLLTSKNEEDWSLVVALAVTWIYKRWRDGIAGPTLMGALTYGICHYLAMA